MARRPPLGQHFLATTYYADRAVEAANLTADDTVLEIGPGKGVLTKRLAALAGKVVCIELDDALADDLPTWAPNNVRLVRGDAVTAPWPDFTACVANLPYQISSPFLFRLLTCEFRVAVLLVQREFADRLIAKVDSKQYGRLSINAQRRAHIERIVKVPPGAFAPPPKVDSAIVRVTPKAPEFEVADEALYEQVVLAAFNARRKKLSNGLRSLPAPWRDLAADVPGANQRPGELSPADFAAVVAYLVEAART